LESPGKAVVTGDQPVLEFDVTQCDPGFIGWESEVLHRQKYKRVRALNETEHILWITIN